MFMMMGLWLIVPLLLIGVVALPYGWRIQSNATKSNQSSNTPSDILKARYVSGEITSKEYEQMRLDLES